MIEISAAGEEDAEDGNFAVEKKRKKCFSVFVKEKGKLSDVRQLTGGSTGLGLELSSDGNLPDLIRTISG